MKNLEKKVDSFDFYHCVIRQGFSFTSIMEPSNILDAIVVRTPERCQSWTPKKTFSEHSLQDHIDIINQCKLEKACIIAENIDFIVQCPSLKYIEIIPADTAPEQFDYSPLYNMPEIKYLSCVTAYGGSDEPLCTSINCSDIKGLQILNISGRGDSNYKQISSLEQLQISDCKIKDFTDISSCRALKKLVLNHTGLKSLQGIAHLQNLQQLSISYERNLYDISEIKKISNSLRSLSIENCPKIIDFSFLMELKSLEHLELRGKNQLYNLNFLSEMHELKTFIFSMQVKDNNLAPCLNVPYVWSIKNRREYNYKDKDLPKNLFREPFRIL